jgi:hypothetical protein
VVQPQCDQRSEARTITAVMNAFFSLGESFTGSAQPTLLRCQALWPLFVAVFTPNGIRLPSRVVFPPLP